MKGATLVLPPQLPQAGRCASEHSALPTHTGARASRAHSWMHHRLEYSR